MLTALLGVWAADLPFQDAWVPKAVATSRWRPAARLARGPLPGDRFIGEELPDALALAALAPLLANPQRRARETFAATARAQGRPDAAGRLADAILATAGHQAALSGDGAPVSRLPPLLD